MIWTIFGISLISIFTAAMTNVMWEVISGPTYEMKIQGSKIGVMRGSIEKEIVLKVGGTPIGMPKFIFRLSRNYIYA